VRLGHSVVPGEALLLALHLVLGSWPVNCPVRTGLAAGAAAATEPAPAEAGRVTRALLASQGFGAAAGRCGEVPLHPPPGNCGQAPGALPSTGLAACNGGGGGSGGGGAVWGAAPKAGEEGPLGGESTTVRTALPPGVTMTRAKCALEGHSSSDIRLSASAWACEGVERQEVDWKVGRLQESGA
jgi:hypothetical protein